MRTYDPVDSQNLAPAPRGSSTGLSGRPQSQGLPLQALPVQDLTCDGAAPFMFFVMSRCLAALTQEDPGPSLSLTSRLPAGVSGWNYKPTSHLSHGHCNLWPPPHSHCQVALSALHTENHNKNE